MKGILILLTCILLVNCQSQESHSDTSLGNQAYKDQALELYEDIPQVPLSTNEPISPEALQKGSKIIKNGTLTYEVSHLEKAKSKIDSLIGIMDAHYENEFFQSYGNRIEYSLKIRIPNSKFDSLVTLLDKGLGRLISKNISAQDVTEEYVDLNIRLANNLAYLQQYQSILKKANSIKEILDVQEKIRRIEEEIDSKKGRLKFLDDQVNYSTLNLEISELISSQISNKPNFGLRISNAFKQGISGFLSFIVGLINFWPFLLLLVLLYLVRKPILGKMRRKKKTPS